MCIVCYTVFSKWKTATNPEMPGQSGSVMVDLNKNEAGDRYLLEFAHRSGKRLNDTSSTQHAEGCINKARKGPG